MEFKVVQEGRWQQDQVNIFTKEALQNSWLHPFICMDVKAFCFFCTLPEISQFFRNKKSLEKPFCFFPRSSHIHPLEPVRSSEKFMFFIKAYLCGYFFLSNISILMNILLLKMQSRQLFKTNTITPPIPCGK